MEKRSIRVGIIKRINNENNFNEILHSKVILPANFNNILNCSRTDLLLTMTFDFV